MICARLLLSHCYRETFSSSPSVIVHAHLIIQCVHVCLFAMVMQVGLASVYPSRHDAAATLVASECARDDGSFAMDEAALHLALTRCVDVVTLRAWAE